MATLAGVWGAMISLRSFFVQVYCIVSYQVCHIERKKKTNMFCQYDLLDRMFITLVKMTFQRISNIPRCYILWVVFDISLQCLWRLIKNIFLCVLTGPVSFSNQAFFLLMTYSLVNYLELHTSSSLEIYYSFRPLRKTELCN